MRTLTRIGLCLLIACLISIAGCKKKEEPAAPPSAPPPPPTSEVKSEAQKAAQPAATEAKTEAAKAVEQVKTAVSETTPLADVKAEAAKMSVEQLKTKAMSYKDLIVAKKATLEQLTAKLKAIPLTEQMGTEAKGLQADIAAANKSISALTERFQVYYGKIKEMGGSVAGLEI